MKATSRDAASPWTLNPVRFMQLALAATMLLSVSYMWQFTAQSVAPVSEEVEAANAKDAAAKLVEAADAALAVQRDRAQAHTQYVVRGFEEAHKFVREYDVEAMGPLFMLFMADTDANGTYWFPPCQQVKEAVHKGFKRAPRGSRLVEIRVGAQDYWNDLANPFRQNQLFYIDYLPTLMRYEGGGNSSSLLAGPNCLNQDLLDVVFQVNAPAAGKPVPNRVMHMTNTKQVIDFLKFYDYTYPVYMFFVSGVHSFNGRMWCPFCDKAEIPVMHYFNYTAPANAVLLHIVVAREPRQWFDEDNDFVGPEFSKYVWFDGVPYLGFVGRNETSQQIKVKEFAAGVDEHAKLQDFFRQRPAAAAIAPASK
ncbi:hypothetical protein PHYBOEH_002500 [Phytophthora boehmeriae]|uniref:Thioredoxin domain-containing protein n=1 Tax=Phytophthora boehmeriae TaxID=109152 RepID=A0A8T1WWY1_9STRA|nr:hypothetical protein PHYBOEH_002500 [Phytophthora boehmeriae]